MLKYIMVIFSLFLTVNLYSLTFNLDGKFKGIFLNRPGCIVPDEQNPLRYNVFNLFDGDLKQALAVNVKYKLPLDEVTFPYFYVRLRNSIMVDEIRIWNGYQKSEKVYLANSRVKEIRIEFCDYSYTNEKFGYKTVLEKVQELEDTTNVQVIRLEKEVKFDVLSIDILSTYPGTTYDDTCISEIEFWYKGQKYRVANLEEAKREFLANWREKQLSKILGYVVEYEPPIYFGNGEIVEVESVDYWIHDMVRKNMEARGMRELSWTNRQWKWVLSWKLDGGKLMYRVMDMKGGVVKKWQEIRPIKKIGEWRMDENGVIFIREIGGEWERMSAEEWLHKKYGDGWCDPVSESFSRDFSANDADSDLQIGDRGVKIYTLVELWKQGKLKVPER